MSTAARTGARRAGAESWGRLFAAFGGLAVLWVVVYWLWQPGEPRISFAPAAATDGAAGVAAATAASENQIAGKGVPIADGGAGLATPGSAGSAGSAGRPEAEVRGGVIPPKFVEHVVRDGETMESIAAARLGSSRLAGAIARANPLLDPARLWPGRVLRIPLDPTNIQGIPAPAGAGEAETRTAGTPNGEQGQPAAGGGAKPQAAAGPAVEYVVKSGDSLSAIAQRHYGSSGYATFIFNANRDALASPDRLRAGQKLRLPPKPAEGTR